MARPHWAVLAGDYDNLNLRFEPGDGQAAGLIRVQIAALAPLAGRVLAAPAELPGCLRGARWLEAAAAADSRPVRCLLMRMPGHWGMRVLRLESAAPYGKAVVSVGFDSCPGYGARGTPLGQ